ncbi:RHS repeat domain-containing protein [Virgisporangium aurantiacum]|uniref:RHS repeat domain-containing protein n=1 Tax=Virgisporangium aurantiacum TaxID=175570 RepID=UPI0019509CBE|nr:RHS repeat-associated core domain-containing protein [Virgisporangium aurantiacum]
MQYYFGRGYNMGSDRLDESKWTWSAQYVPVYSNNPWEPCYRSSSLYDNRCYEAYRWNLDYVVDPRGNSMTYFYEPYVGSYGGLAGTHGDSWYALAATLKRVEYGTRVGQEWSSPAPMRVSFDASVRCPDDLVCENEVKNWPDTPWDLYCAEKQPANQCAHYSPSFWTPLKLESARTEVWNSASNAYTPVDRYDFTYSYPPNGDHVAPFGTPGNPLDDTTPSLWLDTITRTGLASGPGVTGGQVVAPVVSFGGSKTNNRVSWGDNAGGAVPLMHWRVTAIDNGVGGRTDIWYKQPNCSATASNPAYPSTEDNTMACWPQYYNGNWVWFHKNLVDSVVEWDETGGGEAETWRYDYAGWGSNIAALWAYDTNDTIPEARRSWSQWRGYPVVETSHGPNGGPYQTTRALFYRGMNADRGPGGSTRSATITDSQGTVSDPHYLAGQVRERTVLDDQDIPTSTIIEPTATQITGVFPNAVWRHRPGVTRTRTNMGPNTWRWTRTDQEYDQYGQVTKVKNVGDEAVTGDETCTTTEYAYNTTDYLKDFPSRMVTRGGAQCATSEPVLGETRTFYDGSTTLGAPPTTGLPTKTQNLVSTGPDVWATTEQGYDTQGRVTSGKDGRGQTSTIAYTPASGGPLLQTTATNPLGQTTVTTLEPGRGATTVVSDPNSKVTTTSYDSLGRLVKVWEPGRPTSGVPDVEYVYAPSSTAASSVTTKRLGPTGNIITSYELFDGRARPRQTQQPAPLQEGPNPGPPGRIISDTAYDDYGKPVKTSTFHATGDPGTALVGFADDAVARQTRTTYDLLGRTTSAQTWSLGTMKWQTTYTHGGDRTTTFPPSGGATRTEWDALGRTTKLHLFPNSAGTGTPETTSYTYHRSGDVATVTDTAGNVTSYGYDLAKRRTSTTDRDTGTSTTVYNVAGDVLSSTDARQQKTSFEYDAIGRVTNRWAGEVGTGTRLVSYTYDTLAAGQRTSATRYANDGQYVTSVTGFTDDYQPTGVSVSIPLGEGLLAGSYDLSMTYNPYTGAPATLTYPAQHGAPAETITYGYDTLGNPTAMGGLAEYVSETHYTKLGELSSRRHGSTAAGPGKMKRTYTWDDATGRLAAVKSSRTIDNTPTWSEFQNDTYTYTPTGDITGIKDTLDGQSQCFRYDPQHRLTEAYTALDNCVAAPTTAAIAGSGKYPYWDSWTFDNAGRRATDTHRTAGTTTGRTYTYPASGATAVRPHAMTSVTKTGTGAGTDSFTYDNAGNLATRTINGVNQTYTFNSDNQLAQAVVQAAGGNQTTRHLYDPDGGLLIRREPGATTLYAVGQEFRLANGNITTTRYYSHDGATVAVRTPTGLTWLAGDHQGSASIALNPATNTIQKRWYTPYGTDRATLSLDGTPATWPTDRGFLNKQTNPSTGLIDMGARGYDPTYGVFISPDPLVNINSPVAFNPYAYSAHSPITRSDPDGLDPGGNCSVAGTCNSQVTGCQATNYKGPGCGGVVGAPSKPPTKPTSKKCGWTCKAKNFGKSYAGMWWGAAHDIAMGTANYVWDNYVDAWESYEEGGIGGAAKWAGLNVACVACRSVKDSWAAEKGIAANYKAAWDSAKAGDWAGAGRNAIVGTVTLATMAAPFVKLGLRGAPTVAGPKGPSKAAGPLEGGGRTPLRQQYVAEVNGLNRLGNTLRASGASAEATARALHAQRRIIGEQYKGLTPPDALGKIYARNIERYGDKLGPSIDWLRGRGKSWEDIIESAGRSGGKDLGL